MTSEPEARAQCGNSARWDLCGGRPEPDGVKGRPYRDPQFHRLKPRVGPMKAIIAVAASMLTSAFHMLTTGSEYKDLGAAHFDRRDHAKLAKRLVRRLEDLGLKVTVSQAA